MEGSVAAARFQVVSVARAVDVPGAPRSVRTAGQVDRPPVVRRYRWRFLAANNRRLAIAPLTFDRAGECLVAIRALQSGLAGAVVELSQVSSASWEWRVRLDGVDRAIADHRYLRLVRAQLAGEMFLVLVRTARTTDADVQLMSR